VGGLLRGRLAVVREFGARPFAKHLGLFLLGAAIYVQLASHFSFTGTGTVLRMEGPLLAYLYGLSYLLLGRCRSARLRAVIAAAPIVALYLTYDLYFILFGKIPLLAEVSEIPELLGVLETRSIVVGAAVLLLGAAGYLYFARPTLIFAFATLPLLVIASAAVLSPAAVTATVETVGAPMADFSIARNVARNGRVVMLLYYEAKRRVNKEKLLGYADMPPEARASFTPMVVAGKIKPRDVTIVVLESFVDPNLLPALGKGPFGAPEFLEKYAPHQGFSISPVFGGSTPQAEFEVLCGLPAFRAVDSIEFNVFTGAQTYCLPRALSSLGYRLIASHGYKPDFFNRFNAYTGLGFGSLNFPQEFMMGRPSYLSSRGAVDDYMFDGDLLAQNLEHLRKQKSQSSQPIFNYVLGVYGHYPFNLDARHPPVYALNGHPEPLRKVVNQYYYRTRAVAEYLDGLRALSPDGVIIVMSDHLPTITKGVAEFEQLGYPGGKNGVYHNRILMLDRGRFVALPPMYHFNIPNLLFDRLSDGAYCRRARCARGFTQSLEEYRRDYYAVMASAAREREPSRNP